MTWSIRSQQLRPRRSPRRRFKALEHARLSSHTGPCRSPSSNALRPVGAPRRGCGEGIAAGELRVGIEAFVAGRVADTWQHPGCALNACFLEVAPAKRGKCKATDEPFAKGDARLTLCSKDHKTFYGVKGMGDALRPILDAVDDFAVSDIRGLADLDDENRAAVLAALGVDDDANAGAKKRTRKSSAANVSVAEIKLGKPEDKAEASPHRARREADDAPPAPLRWAHLRRRRARRPERRPPRPSPSPSTTA